MTPSAIKGIFKLNKKQILIWKNPIGTFPSCWKERQYPGAYSKTFEAKPLWKATLSFSLNQM